MCGGQKSLFQEVGGLVPSFGARFSNSVEPAPLQKTKLCIPLVRTSLVEARTCSSMPRSSPQPVSSMEARLSFGWCATPFSKTALAKDMDGAKN